MAELTPVDHTVRTGGPASAEAARTSFPRRRLEAWGVFLLGTALSLLGAGRVSLWADEAATVSAAHRSWGQLWRLLHHIDAVHGLYYAEMKVWTDIVGTSEVALRLPSALAVGGTAVGTLFLGRRLLGPSGALLAATVCVLLPRLTWAGIEARSFADSALLATWATVLLLRAVERPSRWRWPTYAGVAAVGIVLNVYIVLLVMGHGATVLLLHRRRAVVRSYVLAAACAGLVASPLVLAVRSQQAQLGADGERSPAALLRKVIINQYFLGSTPSADATSHRFDQLWQAAGVGLALVAGGLVVLTVVRCLRSREDALLAVTLPWIVLPTVIIVAYAIAVAPIYRPYYLTFTAPAICLLLASGLLSLRRRARLVVAGLLIVGVLVVYTSQRVPFAKSGSDWKAAAATVARLAHPGDAVYFVPRYEHDGRLDEATARRIAVAYPDAFARLDDLTQVSSGASTGTLDGYSERLTDVADSLAGHRAVWMVYGEQYPASVIEEGRRVLTAAGFEETESWSGPRTHVLEFTPVPVR